MGNLLDIALKRRMLILSNPVFVWDTDFQNVMDYATTESITMPSEPTLKAANNLLVALKTIGIWTLLDSFALFQFNDSGTDEFSLIDWKRLTEMTIHGGMSYGINGWKGDGTSGYLGSGFIPSAGGNNMTINSIGIGHGFMGDFTSSALMLVGTGASSPTRRIAIFPNNPANNLIFANELNTANVGTKITTARIVMYGRDNGDRYVNVNGTHYTQTVAALSPIIPNEYYIGAFNNNGTPSSYSDGTNTFFMAGAKNTSTMASQFKAAYNIYLTAIGLTPIA